MGLHVMKYARIDRVMSIWLLSHGCSKVCPSALRVGGLQLTLRCLQSMGSGALEIYKY